MMAKRLTDICLAALGLILVSPLLAAAMLLVWAQDGHSPLFRTIRVGVGDRDFWMLKLRTMTIDAEARGGSSTARSDTRITFVGRLLRRWKLDEIPQFWNVLRGDMSLVGPRPNVRRGGTDRYTHKEMRLLTVRPGITDLSSIVFADEGDILDGSEDPDALYDAVIRPWKSRLGLLYIDRCDFGADLRIIWLTVLGIVARRAALRGVDTILAKWNAGDDLRGICSRRAPLPRAAPPGLAI